MFQTTPPPTRRFTAICVAAALLVTLCGCTRFSPFGRRDYAQMGADPFVVQESQLARNSTDVDMTGRARLDTPEPIVSRGLSAPLPPQRQTGPSLDDFMSQPLQETKSAGLDAAAPGFAESNSAAIAAASRSLQSNRLVDDFVDWADQQQNEVVQTAGELTADGPPSVLQTLEQSTSSASRLPAGTGLTSGTRTASSEATAATANRSAEPNPFATLDGESETLPQSFPGNSSADAPPSATPSATKSRDAAGWRPSNFQHP